MDDPEDTNHFPSLSFSQYPYIPNFDEITNNQGGGVIINQLPEDNTYQSTTVGFTTPIPIKRTNFNLRERNPNNNNMIASQGLYEVRSNDVSQHDNSMEVLDGYLSSIYNEQNFQPYLGSREMYGNSQQFVPVRDNISSLENSSNVVKNEDVGQLDDSMDTWDDGTSNIYNEQNIQPYWGSREISGRGQQYVPISKYVYSVENSSNGAKKEDVNHFGDSTERWGGDTSNVYNEQNLQSHWTSQEFYNPNQHYVPEVKNTVSLRNSSNEIKNEDVSQFGDDGTSSVYDEQSLQPNWDSRRFHDNNQQFVTDNYNNNLTSVGNNTSSLKNSSNKPKSTRRRRHSFHMSTIRAKKDTMTMDELQKCLDRKLEEKLLHNVPVTLLDKTHAKCGICESIISLNKKFEIVHVVRHFLAWHKTDHNCTRTWPGLKGPLYRQSKTYSKHFEDCSEGQRFFSESEISFVIKNRGEIVPTKINPRNNDKRLLYGPNESRYDIKCQLCGILMEHRDVSTHFHSLHSGVINTPKCNLCTQEVLINAELKFIYGINYQLSIIDEGNLRTIAIDKYFTGIDELYKSLYSLYYGENSIKNETTDRKKMKKDIMLEAGRSNSSRNLGRGLKPKRTFVHPKYRQAFPKDSPFVEEIEKNHWKCKLCNASIVGAVISSAATKHFKANHIENSIFVDETTKKNKFNPNSILYKFCMELCNARLNKCSKGFVRMIDERTISCEKCRGYYMTLHKEFNICRGIRHLKKKHPELMPEYNEMPSQEKGSDGDSIVTEENKGKLVEEDVLSVTEVIEDDSENVQTKIYHDLVTIPYSTDNSESPITYVYDSIPDNTPVDYNVQYDEYYNNSVPINNINNTNISPNYSSEFYTINNSNNYSSSTTLPLQEIIELTKPMEPLHFIHNIEDAYNDFYSKVPFRNYSIPFNTIDSIVKTYDMDGTECFILLTEEEKYGIDVAEKIFYKRYSRI